MKITHICNPENRRARFFREACLRLGLPEPDEVAWVDLLGERGLPRLDTDAIRIESPGENFDVERSLIAKGGGPEFLREDVGRIRHQRPWFDGWKSVLGELETRYSDSRFMNDPAEIVEMFDKPAAQRKLASAGVPVPDFVVAVESFDQLIHKMNRQGVRRVFLKPAHGSSASGVVAFQTDGKDRFLATTSATLDDRGGMDSIAIYNNLRMQRYVERDSIQRLVDGLAQERLFAERWFPKASLDGRTFDLRVVVIAGVVAQIVVRTSQSPITNLHLGNARGNVDQVKARMGAGNWARAMHVCEDAAKCFQGCHYVAVDLMIGTTFHKFAVAEVNAFGDLIPGVLFEGDDTYTAELRSFLNQ
ncbi:MAG: STM4014 family protein [Verrucomicrobiales bacterium]|nr:STM4014 family protein [Verrucomicrobiales bacterium]